MFNLDEIKGRSFKIIFQGKEKEIKEPSLEILALLQELERTEDDLKAVEITGKIFEHFGFTKEEFNALTPSQLKAVMEQVKIHFL